MKVFFFSAKLSSSRCTWLTHWVLIHFGSQEGCAASIHCDGHLRAVRIPGYACPRATIVSTGGRDAPRSHLSGEASHRSVTRHGTWDRV